jgi:F-type H+-transporting ATPase subunit delta
MSAIGRRYAKALLELADEQKQMDAVVADIAKVREAWQLSADFRELVSNPVLPRPAIKSVLNAILEKLAVSDLVRNTLNLLVDRGRLAQLDQIMEEFDVLAEAKTGRVRAEITTARPMSDSYFEQLKTKLAEITGAEVVVVKKEDPSLIGGVVTRIGDQVFDGSIKNRLTELRETLLGEGTTP